MFNPDGENTSGFVRFKEVSSASGQVRFLAFVSFLLAIWQAFQVQFFISIPTFAWLGFHHVSSLLSVLVTFLKRGSPIALAATVVALLADLILFFTSLLTVTRCLNPVSAAENCPTRLIQGGWMVLFSGQHCTIALFEVLSLRTFNNLLQKRTEEWEFLLEKSNEEQIRRLEKDAKVRRLRRSAGVRRRIGIFSIVPGIAYWVFAVPASQGILATIAGTKLAKDIYSIWSSEKESDIKSRQSQQVFSTITTVLSGVYLFITLSAWLWAEETADFEDFQFSYLWDGAKSAFNDPFSWAADGLEKGTTANIAPFLLLFAFLESLSISTVITPLRAN